MKRLRCAGLVVLTVLSVPCRAQELPSRDPRILTLSDSMHGLLHVPTQPNVSQTVLFERGEPILSVILSDPSAYKVVVNATGDALTLIAMRATSAGLMTVQTETHSFKFQLTASTGRPVPLVINLEEHPRSSPQPRRLHENTASPGRRFGYRLSGKKALRPTSISDDGKKTFIQWAGDRAMPATFAEGPTGDEQMVNGYMRGSTFVIDRVYQELIFRIDKKKAKAFRNDEAGRHD